MSSTSANSSKDFIRSPNCEWIQTTVPPNHKNLELSWISESITLKLLGIVDGFFKNGSKSIYLHLKNMFQLQVICSGVKQYIPKYFSSPTIRAFHTGLQRKSDLEYLIAVITMKDFKWNFWSISELCQFLNITPSQCPPPMPTPNTSELCFNPNYLVDTKLFDTLLSNCKYHEIKNALESNRKAYESILKGLEMTIKRVNANLKYAVPQIWIKKSTLCYEIQLLVPLYVDLHDNGVVSTYALVLRKNRKNMVYLPVNILTVDNAWSNARLVGPITENWLIHAAKEKPIEIPSIKSDILYHYMVSKTNNKYMCIETKYEPKMQVSIQEKNVCPILGMNDMEKLVKKELLRIMPESEANKIWESVITRKDATLAADPVVLNMSRLNQSEKKKLYEIFKKLDARCTNDVFIEIIGIGIENGYCIFRNLNVLYDWGVLMNEDLEIKEFLQQFFDEEKMLKLFGNKNWIDKIHNSIRLRRIKLKSHWEIIPERLIMDDAMRITEYYKQILELGYRLKNQNLIIILAFEIETVENPDYPVEDDDDITDDEIKIPDGDEYGTEKKVFEICGGQGKTFKKEKMIEKVLDRIVKSSEVQKCLKNNTVNCIELFVKRNDEIVVKTNSNLFSEKELKNIKKAPEIVEYVLNPLHNNERLTFSMEFFGVGNTAVNLFFDGKRTRLFKYQADLILKNCFFKHKNINQLQNLWKKIRDPLDEQLDIFVKNYCKYPVSFKFDWEIKHSIMDQKVNLNHVEDVVKKVPNIKTNLC